MAKATWRWDVSSVWEVQCEEHNVTWEYLVDGEKVREVHSDIMNETH